MCAIKNYLIEFYRFEEDVWQYGIEYAKSHAEERLCTIFGDEAGKNCLDSFLETPEFYVLGGYSLPVERKGAGYWKWVTAKKRSMLLSKRG